MVIELVNINMMYTVYISEQIIQYIDFFKVFIIDEFFQSYFIIKFLVRSTGCFFYGAVDADAMTTTWHQKR